jgi:hypothetical protein
MPSKPKSLIDEYDNHTKRPGKACGVAALLEQLDADTASQALGNRGFKILTQRDISR